MCAVVRPEHQIAPGSFSINPWARRATRFTLRRPSRVIATDRFFPSDPTRPYQWARKGKGGGWPSQIPTEMASWVTGSSAMMKWEPSARGMMAEYHE